MDVNIVGTANSPSIEAGVASGKTKGLNWITVAGMGIAFAVSGSFSGWNVGLGIGGWGGMLLAALVMACMYFCLTQCIAELAAACPGEAEGMDSLAAIGLGSSGRFFAGISIAAAVGVAVGISASFIEAYCLSVLGVGGLLFKTLLIVAFLAIQLRGAREAAFLTMAGGFLSLSVLIIFCAAMSSSFSFISLYSQQHGEPTLFPNGVAGVMQCIPYALFMFLGVEQAANAAGDMHDPMKNLPKAIFVSVGSILLIGVSVLVFASGVGVIKVAAAEGNPLFVAVANGDAVPAKVWFEKIVGIGSIISLIATAFSLYYTSSRQFFSLAKAGYLPPGLAVLNSRGAPSRSIWLVGALAMIGMQIDPDTVLVCFIFCLGVCNGLVLTSFLRARRFRSDLVRPYQAIGGRFSAAIALVLVAAVLVACVQLKLDALNYVVLAYSIFAIYYMVRKRRYGMN